MKNFIVLLVCSCLVLAALGAYVWSGHYNISARVPHWNATHELLETVRDRSIAAHSKNIVLSGVDDPRLGEIGFHHYHAMCRLCHGSPGFSPEEFAQGLYPAPPSLTTGNVQKEWNDAALFWIVANGLKMSGMPAFGVTHSTEEILGMVMFLRRLPGQSAAEYRSLVDTARAQGEESTKPAQPHDHQHQ